MSFSINNDVIAVKFPYLKATRTNRLLFLSRYNERVELQLELQLPDLVLGYQKKRALILF